jgi:uncharacterized surface protein with fasciclin (FAS1) repeats
MPLHHESVMHCAVFSETNFHCPAYLPARTPNVLPMRVCDPFDSIACHLKQLARTKGDYIMLNALRNTLVAATILAAPVAFTTTAFAASHGANPMVGGAEMFPDKNIVENAVNSADHTTLVAAVQAAGLVDTLSGTGPFTVFAPTNDAFAKLPEGTVETLLKPDMKDTLTKVLTCHVVAADAMSEMIGKMIADDGGTHPVNTVGGCVLQAKMDGDTITLTDEKGGVANVTIADVKQSNGVIHVIDSVLLPK